VEDAVYDGKGRTAFAASGRGVGGLASAPQEGCGRPVGDRVCPAAGAAV